MIRREKTLEGDSWVGSDMVGMAQLIRDPRMSSLRGRDLTGRDVSGVSFSAGWISSARIRSCSFQAAIVPAAAFVPELANEALGGNMARLAQAKTNQTATNAAQAFGDGQSKETN
jgi:hypothetical protein